MGIAANVWYRGKIAECSKNVHNIACVRTNGEFNDWFPISLGVRQ